MVGKGPDGTVQIEVPDTMADEGNPFAMVRSEGSGNMMLSGMMRSSLNGIPVYFANRADMESADRYIRELMDGEGEPAMLGGGGRRRRGNGVANNFLETGGDVALSVGSYLQSQQLRRLRGDLLDAVDASNAARDSLNKLSANTKYAEIVPVLQNIFDAERQKTDVSVQILDAEVTAVDIQTGGNVAKVIGDLWGGASSGWGNNGSSGLVVGAVGLGLGAFLASNRNNRNR